MPLALVTGGSGFVGGQLVERLLEDGVSVRATFRRANSVIEARDLEWVRVPDLEREKDWSRILENVGYVYHLAGLAHRLDADDDRLESEYARVNVEGTRNLVTAVAQSQSVRRFLFVSSVAAVTGRAESVVTSESECAPEGFYGRSKLASENILCDILKKQEPDWSILRPCLVYGPGNPGNMARLQRLVQRGVPLPFRSVRNRRSFLFVGNLVDALVSCATHRNAHNRIFPVSDGADISTRELVEKIASASGKRARLVSVPEPVIRLAGHAGDLVERMLRLRVPISTSTVEKLVGSLVVDSAEIRKALAWHPPYTLDEGLLITFARHAAH